MSGSGSAARRGLAAVVSLALTASGCLEFEYGSEPFLCDRTGICPEGYSCVAGRCTTRGDADGDGTVYDVPQFPDRLGSDSIDGPVVLDGGQPDQGPGDQQAADQWPPPGIWVEIAAGPFTMGSPPTENCRESDEQQHEVTLSRGFTIMTRQVTRAMFQQVRGYLPAGLSGCDDCPVGNVTWHEAARYCNALSNQAGLDVCYDCSGVKTNVACSYGAAYPGKQIYDCPGYRLPTEAEWEYACRAGTKGSLYNGNLVTCDAAAPKADEIAWYSENSGNKPHPVGQKIPNDWGLYDMAGNAWDWIHDRYVADLKIDPETDPVRTSGANACQRGGGYGSWPTYLRSANRGWKELGARYDGTGLRCVRTLP